MTKTEAMNRKRRKLYDAERTDAEIAAATKSTENATKQWRRKERLPMHQRQVDEAERLDKERQREQRRPKPAIHYNPGLQEIADINREFQAANARGVAKFEAKNAAGAYGKG